MASNPHSSEVNLNLFLTTKPWFNLTTENATDTSTQTGNRGNLRILNFVQSFESIQIWKLNLVLSIIYGSGTIANTFLLAYLIYYKRYKSPIFCVILSLCICDLGDCIASLMMLRTFPIMGTPRWMCKATIAVLHVSFLSSSYHIVLFAALRFFQLVFPLYSRASITISRLSKICVAIWVADFIQAGADASYYEVFEVDYRNEIISVCWFTGNRFITNIWVTVTWFMLPFAATAVLHFSKHIILLCRTSAPVAIASAPETGQQRRKKTDTRALALVLILYLLSLLPTIVQFLRHTLFEIPRSTEEWKLIYISELMLFLNSPINPWIYMFAAESVRSDIRKMFVCRKIK